MTKFKLIPVSCIFVWKIYKYAMCVCNFKNLFFSLNVVITCNCYLYIITCWCMEYIIVQKIVSDRLSQLDCVSRGWVLHGYPRTRVQGEMMAKEGFLPWVDMSLHWETLSWFWANQSLLFLFNGACLVEKQQIAIL
jgi:hypothetical protein